MLTGHTADDQAETVLLNLLRGAGADGLAGMRENGRVGRPLLGLRRRETGPCARSSASQPVDDPTNADPSFARNRIRHDLLPLMAELAGRDLVPILARQAGLLADDVELLDELADEIDPSDASALAAARPALARRAVRRWLRAGAGPEHHPPSAAEVERVLAVARGDAVACQLAGGRPRSDDQPGDCGCRPQPPIPEPVSGRPPSKPGVGSATAWTGRPTRAWSTSGTWILLWAGSWSARPS